MKWKIFIVSIVLLFGLISGCVEQQKDDDTPDVTVEKGFVDFQVTDKVTEDFDHVNVTFTEIRLFHQDAENESYIVAVSEPKTVDLIALNLSHINASLGIAEIETGNYSKLWLNVSECHGVLHSTGEEVNITVPSGWLKIQQLHVFNVSKGNHTILVDIDLEESIHTFHGGEEYKFIPVISKIEHKHEHNYQFKEHNKSNLKHMQGNSKPVIDLLINGSFVKKTAYLDANTSYVFNASGTLDLDGDPLTFSWDFGDDETATGSIVNHTYAEDGVYQLWLTVSDGEDESSKHIIVRIGDQSKEHGKG